MKTGGWRLILAAGLFLFITNMDDISDLQAFLM